MSSTKSVCANRCLEILKINLIYFNLLQYLHRQIFKKFSPETFEHFNTCEQGVSSSLLKYPQKPIARRVLCEVNLDALRFVSGFLFKIYLRAEVKITLEITLFIDINSFFFHK